MPERARRGVARCDVHLQRELTMPELFASSTQEFIDRTMQNRIARDLKDAFFAFHGFNPFSSEHKS
jgi:hypothetical protein